MRYYAVTYSNSLSHHGIKGQKWGVRRYRNEDGSLTPEGKKRLSSKSKTDSKNPKTYASSIEKKKTVSPKELKTYYDETEKMYEKLHQLVSWDVNQYGFKTRGHISDEDEYMKIQKEIERRENVMRKWIENNPKLGKTKAL